MIFFPTVKSPLLFCWVFFLCFINRKTFRKMSFNVFSYTLHTQRCSLATTIAVPPLTFKHLLGALLCCNAYVETSVVIDCGITAWYSEGDRSVIGKYKDLSSLRNWYTITFPQMSLNKALVALHRSPAGRPQPSCSSTVQSWPALDGFVSGFPGHWLGRFNSFKGTQLPSLFQRCSHASEFLFEHAWQPHQKHLNFVGRYLWGRKRSQFLGKEPTWLGLGEVLLSMETLVFSLTECWALALSVSVGQHGCGMG